MTDDKIIAERCRGALKLMRSISDNHTGYQQIYMRMLREALENIVDEPTECKK